LPGVWLKVSQIEGVRPSSRTAPSIWYAEVAEPQRKAGGKAREEAAEEEGEGVVEGVLSKALEEAVETEADSESGMEALP
jgi:hypothetical protein